MEVINGSNVLGHCNTFPELTEIIQLNLPTLALEDRQSSLCNTVCLSQKKEALLLKQKVFTQSVSSWFCYLNVVLNCLVFQTLITNYSVHDAVVFKS